MFNKKPSIEFVSSIGGILSVNECLPKPYNNFTPKWWSDKKIDLKTKSIKNCPSFPEFFSEAYVIPMWVDTTFYVDGENVTIDTARNDLFKWEFHPRNQFLDFAPKKYFREHISNCKIGLSLERNYSKGIFCLSVTSVL